MSVSCLTNPQRLTAEDIELPAGCWQSLSSDEFVELYKSIPKNVAITN